MKQTSVDVTTTAVVAMAITNFTNFNQVLARYKAHNGTQSR